MVASRTANQMPGKHGWKDGSIQLCVENGDIDAHMKTKKEIVPKLAAGLARHYCKSLGDPTVQARCVFDTHAWPTDKDELATYGDW